MKDTIIGITLADKLFKLGYPQTYRTAQHIIQKWLREKHNIHIIIFGDPFGEPYEWMIEAEDGKHVDGMGDRENPMGLTYEDCLNEAIEHSCFILSGNIKKD